MKILGILGSPRSRGNTAILLEGVMEGARRAGAETRVISVASLDTNFCAGCSHCFRYGQCHYRDDVEKVKEKMLDADGIVLGSPVYIGTVSAQMKTIMDRCAYFIHCFLLAGKYGAAVATAGAGQAEEVAEFQNRFLRMCGAYTVGAVWAKGIGTGKLQDEPEAVARAINLGAELVAAIRERREYPEQAAEHAPLRESMKQLVLESREEYPAQYAHWSEQGWLE
ncbi:MAG: flavodoxin family protein [Armatimonadetes bacterium]|jgi:multimeric flavodoxin WrbA|nr:flavodoxin family protein [Armatimonadota bacterium]